MEPARAPDQMHSTHTRARSHTRAHTLAASCSRRLLKGDLGFPGARVTSGLAPIVRSSPLPPQVKPRRSPFPRNPRPARAGRRLPGPPKGRRQRGVVASEESPAPGTGRARSPRSAEGNGGRRAARPKPSYLPHSRQTPGACGSDSRPYSAAAAAAATCPAAGMRGAPRGVRMSRERPVPAAAARRAGGGRAPRRGGNRAPSSGASPRPRRRSPGVRAAPGPR